MSDGEAAVDVIAMTVLMQLIVFSAIILTTAFLYNKYNSSNKKFNWNVAVLAPWYYAQHGRWWLSLLFGLFYGGLWLFAISVIMIYAGIRADNDLRGLEPKYTYLSVILSLFMLFVFYTTVLKPIVA